MGILNMTPDSFSDGGSYATVEEALSHTEEMVASGADIIDIGGESSRPGSEGVDVKEELDRVIPILRAIKRKFNVSVSIDTTKAAVAESAINEGADMINDISGLRGDPRMAEILKTVDIPVILMHMKGIPRTMQDSPYYEDVIEEINGFFSERIQYAASFGIDRDRLILDPGIGFGKRFEDNIAIINRLDRFQIHGLPILIGLSRKRFLGEICGETDASKRDPETTIANLIAVKNGASILRVHHVDYTRKMLQTLSHFDLTAHQLSE